VSSTSKFGLCHLINKKNSFHAKRIRVNGVSKVFFVLIKVLDLKWSDQPRNSVGLNVIMHKTFAGLSIQSTITRNW
jgi:hypothetical protein